MRAANPLAATLAVLLLPALAWHGAPTQEAAAQDAASPGAHAEPGDRSSRDLPVIAALRANGASILSLGKRGGLDGHFVELPDGDAYGLYLTPDGHAVAGLLYGPDGTLLTGRQIEAARSEDGDGIATAGERPVSAVAPAGEDSKDAGLYGGEVRPGGAIQLAHAYADDAIVPGVEAMFERSVSAFGFTLGRTGPPVAVFADHRCRWSRAAVARLARLALDGRLQLHVVPVGVMGAASAQEAAAIASARDPALAWFEGAPGPASPEGGRRIARNNALFDAWGAGAVPLIAWRARDGRVAHRVGDFDDIDAWLGTLRHE